MTILRAHRRTRIASVLTGVTMLACTAPDSPSPAGITAPSAPLAARPGGGGGGGGGGSAYTVADLGVPAGYSATEAYDVNDAGTVVGMLNGSLIRAFARVGNELVALPPSTASSIARAVSNGTTTYVVGWVAVNGNSQPARWSISGGSISEPTILPNSGFGVATGVNDQGDVVGGNTIWKGSSAETVSPPGTFTKVALTDIDNAGQVVFNASGSATSVDRAFFRHATGGGTIELAPPAELATYYTVADAMSAGNGVVYVAGKVQLDDNTCYAALWTINLADNTTAVTVRAENTGSAWGVSNAGTFVGHQGQGWTTSGFAWPLGRSAIALPMPKGGKNPHVYGVSPNGKFITGWGEFSQLKRHAVLWSGTGP